MALDTLFSWDYNPLNQCVFEYKYRPGLEETDRNYGFDIYGNQISAFTPASTYYTWDVKDRLASATAGDKTITFTYDAEGQRIRKQVAQAANPPKITNYLTDSQNPSGYSQTLEETNNAGAPTTGYAWGSGGALAQRTGAGVVADGSNSQSALGSPQTLHGDHLGSTRLLTDASGEAVEGTRYEYNPFGTHHFNAYYGNATALTALKFTGQYADGDLGGLQYHRARWLNTTRAAWLSADPVYDFPGNFGNAYGYAGQNPVSASDHTGMFSGVEANVSMAIVNTVVSCEGIAANGAKEFALVALQQQTLRNAVNNIIIDVMAGIAITLGAFILIAVISKALASMTPNFRKAMYVKRGINDAAEMRYAKELANKEAEITAILAKQKPTADVPHFFSDHGAGTTLNQQHIRANTGLSPRGKQGAPADSTMFLTHTDQWECYNKALAQRQLKINKNEPVIFDTGEIIGAGYYKGTQDVNDVVYSTTVVAVFDKFGNLKTLYPKLP